MRDLLVRPYVLRGRMRSGSIDCTGYLHHEAVVALLGLMAVEVVILGRRWVSGMVAVIEGLSW